MTPYRTPPFAHGLIRVKEAKQQESCAGQNIAGMQSPRGAPREMFASIQTARAQPLGKDVNLLLSWRKITV